MEQRSGTSSAAPTIEDAAFWLIQHDRNDETWIVHGRDACEGDPISGIGISPGVRVDLLRGSRLGADVIALNIGVRRGAVVDARWICLHRSAEHIDHGLCGFFADYARLFWFIVAGRSVSLFVVRTVAVISVVAVGRSSCATSGIVAIVLIVGVLVVTIGFDDARFNPFTTISQRLEHRCHLQRGPRHALPDRKVRKRRTRPLRARRPQPRGLIRQLDARGFTDPELIQVFVELILPEPFCKLQRADVGRFTENTGRRIRQRTMRPSVIDRDIRDLDAARYRVYLIWGGQTLFNCSSCRDDLCDRPGLIRERNRSVIEVLAFF